VFAICDVYDALTSERPYKPSWPAAVALAELLRNQGQQFDPLVVEAFFDVVRPHLSGARAGDTAPLPVPSYADAALRDGVPPALLRRLAADAATDLADCAD
jgi:hypothetical protein